MAGAACVLLVALAGIALVSRHSRAQARPAVPPDTVIRPLVNGAFNNRVLTHEGRRYFYKVFLPHDYTPAKRWPVIFALHGGRTRGVDNVVQAREGLANVVRAQAATFPAIVIFPQVPTRARGHEFIPVDIAMIDHELAALNGDPDRLYLTGSSFGGYTAYQMAYMYPRKFAALVPVAAAIDLSVIRGGHGLGLDSVYTLVAGRIKPMAVWILHGELDEEINIQYARNIAASLQAQGVNVRFTEFPRTKHSIFTKAWETPGLVPWLLEQRRRR